MRTVLLRRTSSILGVAIGATWLGVAIHSTIAHTPIPGLFVTLQAITRLPRALDRPAAAWPPGMIPTGRTSYWLWTAGATYLLGLLGGLTKQVRLALRAHRRRSHGAEASAFASVRDIAPLVLTEHGPDRVAFASMGKRVLATESPTRPLDRRSREHWTGPGALTFIGGTSATRADSVAAIIERQPSPLIVWTTSPDLLHRTIGARRTLGTVHVHDPCGLTKLGSVGWSPLRAALTHHGAVEVARFLITSGGVETTKLPAKSVEDLLAAALWLAAHVEGPTMSEVEWWICGTLDALVEGTGPRLSAMTADSDDSIARQAARITAQLSALGELKRDVHAGVLASAHRAVQPWCNELVLAASTVSPITFSRLTSGLNTLYVIAPEGVHEDRAVVSGLLIDLVAESRARFNETGRRFSPAPLIVIDEAAAATIPDLADWAATIPSIGINLFTTWQSLEDMKSAYGQRADEVYAAHKTKLFLPGGTPSDADAIQRILAAQRSGAPFRLNPIGSSQPPVGRSSGSVSRSGPQAVLLHSDLPPMQVQPFSAVPEGATARRHTQCR